MKIFIDTNTFADAPAVYADAEKTQALPRVLPLVQGFKGELAVGFLGDRAPSQSARAIFAARPLGSKTDVVQTEPGVIRVEGEATVIRFNITADTTQLAEALGDAESLAVRAGIVVEEEEALCRPARSEWQLTFSVSATALGGDQPDPRPSEADELRSEIAAEAACRAAADEALAAEIAAEIAAEKACRAAADEALREALAAESACRESGQVRVDSKFSEVDAALAEKADAADAVLLAAADSAEKNAASKHGKAALLTVNGGDGGVYISGLANATRADEKWIAKARHDGVRVFHAPGEAPENFGYYAGACFCAGDVIARAKDVACARADVCRSMAAQRDELRTEIMGEKFCRNAACIVLQLKISEEAACRTAADAGLQANIDALDASFGAALCAQNSELREWAGTTFVCRGGDIVVGSGARLEFADSEGGTAAAMRFTDSPSGGVLSVGSASTDAAMTWMSGNYMSWFSPEFLRLYSGASVVSPTAKIEANPNGVILAAGAGDAAKIVIDAGKIQVSGAALTLNVAPSSCAHAATKGYVDAADAALCARICKIEKCGASSACGLPGACVDARIDKAVTSEAACRATADAALRTDIDALDASFGEALCAQRSELREWADARFICRGGDIVVGPGARLEFADSACGTAAAMRFTDSPTGGVLSVGSASTAAAMTWMSGNYMSWFSPEFLRLYSGASVVSPTAKIEANPSGVILAAGANEPAKIGIDAG